MAAQDEDMKEKLFATLSNGVKIPIFGFGCAFGDWTSPDASKAAFSPEEAWSVIPKALRAGVRHFDCAYVYRTHRQVGASIGHAMRDGLVKRKDLFLTTKVLHPSHNLLFGKTCDLLDVNFDVEKVETPFEFIFRYLVQYHLYLCFFKSHNG
jgi:aryl-alcohol dehydrogenase-like predicted oxidoreductase